SPTQQMFLSVVLCTGGALVPSPLVGEGGERSEPGEGAFSSTRASPSPVSPPSLRSGGSSPSPARGEGDAARGEGDGIFAGVTVCPSRRSQRYCATFVSWYSSTKMYRNRA